MSESYILKRNCLCCHARIKTGLREVVESSGILRNELVADSVVIVSFSVNMAVNSFSSPEFQLSSLNGEMFLGALPVIDTPYTKVVSGDRDARIRFHLS